MRSPVNPIASLVVALTLTAALPAIASAQGTPGDPAPAPSRADALARTPSAWVELARSDGRIAFGVKGGGARRAVTVLTPFADVYRIVPSSPVPFGSVHRFGQRGGGAIRVLPNRGNPLMRPWRGGDAMFVAGSPTPMLWNLSSQVRISFGAASRSIAPVDLDSERAPTPVGSVTVAFGSRPR
jgi:hypothetical protein